MDCSRCIALQGLAIWSSKHTVRPSGLTPLFQSLKYYLVGSTSVAPGLTLFNSTIL